MTTSTEALSLNSISAGCRTLPVVAIFADRDKKIPSAERAERAEHRRKHENAFSGFRRCSALSTNA
jgi:hypothetical protein